jgi:hypothetical protein
MDTMSVQGKGARSLIFYLGLDEKGDIAVHKRESILD